MGVVYEAFDRLRRERIALKTIRHLEADAIRRFKREFRTLADIAHPNLVSLYELVATGDDWFFTMELIEGVDVRSKFDAVTDWSEGDAEAALRLSIGQLAEGLAALHRGGHLHRDIKPSNVMVADERTVLLDFGVIGEVGQPVESGKVVLVGTPAYISPEQLYGEHLDFATDWYAVGAVLYKLLTGEAPFKGTTEELMQAKIAATPLRPSALCRGVSDQLEDLCLALLKVDPRQRPDGGQVLAALGRRARRTASIRVPMRTRLVGRRAQLDELADALASVEAGQGVTLLVRGASGMGKTALIDAFLERASRRGDVLTLRGRCHLRELVRYKAVDGLIDALGDHLAGLTPLAVDALLPADAGLLSSAFPALGHLPEVGLAGARTVTDPRLLRARATAALRELLRNLAHERTLILHIDDVQWGDQESAELIAALMDAPRTPPLLLVLSYRKGDEGRSPFLRTLLEHDAGRPTPERCRRVEVGGLNEAEGEELADAVLRRRRLIGGEAPRTIAAESGGSPLFIHAMAQFAEQLGAEVETGLSLERVLEARSSLLAEGARTLLDVVALAGMPTPHSVVRAATGLSAREYDDALQSLRAAQMIRSLGTDEDALVELYHDRVGETQVARMADGERRQKHARLAEALLSTEPDPEVLFLHFRGAGDDERAAYYAILAAERAAAALSFARAATLYRFALDFGDRSEAARGELFEQLGEVLVAQGHGAEAAEAFLAAALAADGAIDLRRRAGEQQLRSGALVEGRQTLSAVMAALDLRLPTNMVSGVAGLLYWRMRLRMRGLRFKARPPEERDPRAVMRVDTMYSVAAGLSVSLPAIASSLGPRIVLEAFRLGDAERVARALLLEVVFVSTEGLHSKSRVDELLTAVRPIVHSTQSPNIIAFMQAIEGVVAFQQGRFAETYELCERARETMLTQCTGMGWEVGTMVFYSTLALTCSGKFSELARAPGDAAEAFSRGDIFTSASVRAAAIPALLLAEGDPAGSRAEADEALRLWGQNDALQNLHFMVALSHIQAHLYEGQGARALARVEADEAGLRRSLMFTVQVIRGFWMFARANARIATAAQGRRDGPALLRAAAKDGAKLLREGAPWCSGLGDQVLAEVALSRGDVRRAAEHSERAAEVLAGSALHHYSRAASLVHGVALGEAGQSIRARAIEQTREAGAQDPQKVLRVFAPVVALSDYA